MRGGEVIACAPLYAKTHSQGEYIFDHNWAHAYERAGGRYYPKLQMASPSPPPRAAASSPARAFEALGRAALIQGAVQIAAENRLSSLHVTFCTEAEAEAGARMGLLHRVTQQFHWENRGYADFDAFLADLSSRKRKNIRKERETAQAFGGEIVALTGDAIEARPLGPLLALLPGHRRAQVGHALPHPRLLRPARRRPAGRHAPRPRPAGRPPRRGRAQLHRARHALRPLLGLHRGSPLPAFRALLLPGDRLGDPHGLARVEAGAQGAHKLARGYLPAETHSLHWFADDRFARAVEQYLEAERQAVDEEIEVLTSYGPFRKTTEE
jgi:uncharacterized protein